MAINKISFRNSVIFALALAEVGSWTIDLPEVRKYIFEKEEKRNEYDNYKYKTEEGSPVFYSNIEGNSKLNIKPYADVYENTAYAREYGYQSYMEKKVNDIVYNGSVYLEGLRRSLESYTRLLEACVRTNGTMRSSQNSTNWRPPIDSPASSNTSANSSRCREVTQTSEHVRRLSELAMWATRELQDIAYARKYKKDEEHSLSMQENELILKLAWFLDRLAHFTGYEPQTGDFLQNSEDGPSSSTTTPAPVSLVSPSPDVKRQMMECLQQNSSEAAVDRCRYPEPLPPLVQLMMEMNSNISGIPSMPAPSSSNQQVVTISRTDPISEQSMELLIAADNRTPSLNLPSLTAVKRVRKRSVLSMFGAEVQQEMRPEVRQESLESAPKIKQASEDDYSPTYLVENDSVINFIKYYAKHKVWDGANSNLDSKKFQTLDVQNLLTHKILKRAIDYKKSKHLKLPENPFQDLSKYKPGVNYVKDEALADKIKAALEKMDEKPTSYKNLIRKLTKLMRQKRSINYENDVDLPRESVNPQKDISYYTKNKPGRNYNNDLLQALQVRTGLEQVFNTGNIEVVRRYGANYNPLVPAPFYAGLLKSQADFRK